MRVRRLENFIFDSDAVDSNLKLIDFGLSKKYGTEIRRMQTMVGTPYYMAPEVRGSHCPCVHSARALRVLLLLCMCASEGGEVPPGAVTLCGCVAQVAADSGTYTEMCDEWSVGVITYMLLTGTPPFRGDKDEAVLNAVKAAKYVMTGPRWEHISDAAKDFVSCLLRKNPKHRLTAEQALRHPWLRATEDAIRSMTVARSVVDSLKRFRHYSTMKKVALEAIAFSLTAAQVQDMRRAFVKIDQVRCRPCAPTHTPTIQPRHPPWCWPCRAGHVGLRQPGDVRVDSGEGGRAGGGGGGNLPAHGPRRQGRRVLFGVPWSHT